MSKTPSARRATGLFWGVMGSSLLVVTGVTLVWFLGDRHEPQMTVFATCWMMMRQIWQIPLQYAESFPSVGLFVLMLLASGAWAGWRNLTAWWRTRRLLARSEPYRPGRWPTLDTALAPLPDVQQRLRMLPTLKSMACTVGLWQPQIMLSAGLIADLSPAELRAVAGHEWGHVRRRDPLRLVLLRFCSSVLWFLPIIRGLARDSARTMEEAADDVAVAMTDQPLELAAALVKAAKAQVKPRWSPAPALGGELAVTERVERLLEVPPTRPPQRHYRAWVASAVVASCLLGLLILPRYAAVAAVPTAPFASQLPMMGCSMDLPQG